MAEDRKVQDAVAAIQELRAEVADLKSTSLARIAAAVAEARRRPTGSTDIVFRGAPEPGTIFLQGQTLNRADYPALWAWAQANGAVVAGGYGAGDGSTTFTVPDMRGKVVRGASTAAALGELVGADSQVLTTSQMPSHSHSGSTGSDSHSHSGSTSSSDGVGAYTVPSGTERRVVADDSDHNHSFTTNSDSHSHSVSIGSTGGTTPVDLRQASLGWHIAVWT